MGTNYYAHLDSCRTCGRADRLHIGKSSGGWTFSFQAYPEKGLVSWETWRKRLLHDDVTIMDEYDRFHTLGEFAALVEKKKDEKFCHACKYPDGNFHDHEGHSFSPGEFS